MGWETLVPMVLSAAKPAAPAGPSTAASDPFFGSLLSSMDSSGWTVNFGDGATQTATTGDRGGNSQTSAPTKATNQIPVAPNAGSVGGGSYSNPLTGSGGGIPWNLVLMFGGAAALILLWKR